jgi:hypothetical protein
VKRAMMLHTNELLMSNIFNLINNEFNALEEDSDNDEDDK